MTQTVVLPRLTGATDPAVQRWANDLVRALEATLAMLPKVDVGYSVTGATGTKALACASPNLTTTTQVLGSLVAALKQGGVLG